MLRCALKIVRRKSLFFIFEVFAMNDFDAANSALVILSGGQDSTTCLFWAKRHFARVEAVTFDYAQRHRQELAAAAKIAQMAQVPQHLLPINTFAALGGNALLDTDLNITQEDNALPNTFVPGRNVIFLSFAAALAYQRRCDHLVLGVAEVDYSGYPDCRKNTIDATALALNLGMETRLQIHTPLMFLSKAETVKLAQELGAMEALAWSHSCYENTPQPCGQCPACTLRARGFAEAGVADPLLTRLQAGV